MLTRRQWLQAGAATLAPGAWAQDGGSVIAARFGSLPARPGRVFASGPPAGVLLAALAPQQLLGWRPRPADAAIVATAASLIRLGLVKTPRR